MKLHHVLLPVFAVCTLNGCYSLVQGMMFGGMMAAISLPSFEATQTKARNAGMRANLNTVRLALEQYAVDHDGNYPAPKDWIKPLVDPKFHYLPDDRMPRQPYVKDFIQRNPLGIADAKGLLRPAGDRQGPTKEGTVLGPGREATSETFDVFTYGAIVYDLEPKKQVYVVYGIAKQGTKAVVSWASNDD